MPLAQARPSVIGDVGFDATRSTLESDECVGLVQAVPVRVVQIAVLDQELRSTAAVAVALTSAFVFLRPTLLGATWSENLHDDLRELFSLFNMALSGPLPICHSGYSFCPQEGQLTQKVESPSQSVTC